MKVIGFDQKTYTLNWAKYKKNTFRNKSAPHQSALFFLSALFPGFPLYEEVTLPGSKRWKSPALYVDIFIPNIPMIVEVHGEQHYKFIPFFHKTKDGFLSAQRADRNKREWADLNSISYVALPHDKEETWKKLITSAISKD